MAQLTVKNFGAVKCAEIDIRKYNFYIGETSSGKSIIAKLISIFNHSLFWSIKDGSFEGFYDLLKKYNIDFEFDNTTSITYINNNYSWSITKDSFKTNFFDKDSIEIIELIESFNLQELDKIAIEKKNKGLEDVIEFVRRFEPLKKSGIRVDMKPFIELYLNYTYNKFTPVYIPAERLLISTFSNTIFSLLQDGTPIPDCIKDFGNLYEISKRNKNRIDIDILDMQVVFSNEGDKVLLKKDMKEIKFSQASSGLQSIIPLWVVLDQYLKNNQRQILVIEEPESNLFPSTQHRLVDWIIGKFNKHENDNNIVFTTHSPYILSAIDNFIFAKEILKKDSSDKTSQRIQKIIPSLTLIDFDDVSSYFFHADGVVKDIRNVEMKSLGAEYIDGASDDLGYVFDQLCEIDNEM